jgi:X-Pro dipeptidyl-peptidase
MVKFNHYSYIPKNMPDMLADLASLGFNFENASTPKAILKEFLWVAPVDMTVLQATEDLTLLEFLKAGDVDLTWETFYNLALQLQGFVAHFDYDLYKTLEFAASVNLPMLDGELTRDRLIEAIYLFLSTRNTSGMLMVEQFVSDGLIPQDNQHHFFNDKALSTFTTHDVIREIVWVESSVDTDADDETDLIKVEIIRPRFEGKLPVVMTASPYHLGTNDKANDNYLHEMKGDLPVKTEREVPIETELPARLDPAAVAESDIVTETVGKFNHGWTYSLNDYFLSRGFASIYVAGVGTRGSEGWMTSGDYQQVYSMTAVIDWLNGRTNAYIRPDRKQAIRADWANGKVAMTGKSYLGTMAYGAATTGIDGLEVILAEAGITSWYDYYRENGAVRSPGGFPGEDLDVLAELTYSRNLDAADYLKNNEDYQDFLEAMTIALERGSGDYNQYWHDRNYRPHIDKVKADVLIVHGLQDWNVRPKHAFEFWKALPTGVAKHAFLHQGAHIYMNNWQSIDFSETINAYFTAKLLEKPLTLSLPPVIWQENASAQTFHALDNWQGSNVEKLDLPQEMISFENAYTDDKFAAYSKNFNSFHADLYAGKLEGNARTIELKVPRDMRINGAITVKTRVRVSDNKGILSAKILETGTKKRLRSVANVLALKAIDLGRQFEKDDLKELTLADSENIVVTQTMLDLHNREGLLLNKAVAAGEWMDVTLTFEPTIYQLAKGDNLKLVLYSTDFELTVRDNRPATTDIDLGATEVQVPIG